MPKRPSIKIISMTYARDGKKYVAVKKANDETTSRGITQCMEGEEKCVDGQVWMCVPVTPGGKECIWFITDEICKK